MDKTITTTLLIAIGMIMALTLFNTAYPAVVQGSDAITSMASQNEIRMRTHIDIIHAAGELDSNGWWQDSNGSGQFEAFVWVKNTGLTRLTSIESLDVFFGPEGNFVRIPHQTQAGSAYPYWTAAVEGSGDWVPTSTLRITLHYSVPPTAGRYFTKVTLPTGVDADFYLGM